MKYQLCRNASDTMNIGAVDQKEENRLQSQIYYNSVRRHKLPNAN